MATTVSIKPEEHNARLYADRLILEVLVEIGEVVKPSEISERLSGSGLGLSAVRSLLASNEHAFAYHERRWVPAARVASDGRPAHEALLSLSRSFGAPVPVALLAQEMSSRYAFTDEEAVAMVRRTAQEDAVLLLTKDEQVAPAEIVFRATDESVDRALRLNGVDETEVAAVEKSLGKFDWLAPDAVIMALEKAAPASIKAIGAAAWKVLNPQDPTVTHLFDWRSFYADLLSVPGFVLSADGVIHPEDDAKKWIATASKLADKLAPTVEIEEAVPLELKPENIESMVSKIVKSDETVTATKLLEEIFEITPQVKTFPDDLANVKAALTADKRVWWVGGDRFRVPGTAPDYIEEVPEPFEYVNSGLLQEDGDPVDAELMDDGLSTSLRKLIVHPLAQDVLDEDIMPAPKSKTDTIRLVLKPIHRELGTFSIAQFPTGWFDEKPEIQEVILIDPMGRKLQVWLNMKLRLIFGFFDWWLDQAVESGAVFQLTQTGQPNVFDFQWLDQTDPVVYISNQRMEELREIAERAEGMSTFDILREVMTHWGKGADFLTILWEINVVRRTSRRLLASLLSSYVCFYQRSGSPVWHYDHKKVEQGFDKTKKKFIKKD
ncbi:MAG: hypothetical protein KF812_03205 [Fimbriimonadaceae bacterium]|nr:hypothetical protein [Fimbriimonadaceae bacterium]